LGYPALGSIKRTADTSPKTNSQLVASMPEASTSSQDFPVHSSDHTSEQPKGLIPRIPSSYPSLKPENRYCKRCEIIKPHRTHHCRHCGTCVLKMDHHCPWVGVCVGARNYKYFFNFLQWSSLFVLFDMTTLIISISNHYSPKTGRHHDPQQIVMATVCGFFVLFCNGLLISHAHLIILNMTTIEHMGYHRNRERENARLALVLPWWDFTGKRKLREAWDKEWGRPNHEGSLWWLGARRNWESVMGTNVWGWFLPTSVSTQKDAGILYERNPRFDEGGNLRPRKYWPSELQ